MLVLRLRLDWSVIDENNDKLIYIGSEYPIHQFHKHHLGIGQIEWYNQKLIMPIPYVESYLRHMFRTNKQLMIPWSQIDLQEHCSPLQLIEQVVDTRKWVLILDQDLIQLPIVYAESHWSIIFLDKQQWCSPLWSTRSDESKVLQLLNLLLQL